MTNILINGFGRIGKVLSRIIINSKSLKLTHINEPRFDIHNISYLLEHDSIYGIFNIKPKINNNSIYLTNKKIFVSHKEDIRDLDDELKNIDIVIDCSGIGKNIKRLRNHKFKKNFKTIFTNSSNDTDIEIIYGLNDNLLSKRHKFISASICDANALAHVINFLDKKYGIDNGSITTVHPLLSYQNLLDGPSISYSNPGISWKDYSLGRSTLNNLIPKNTTAISAVERVIKNIEGKIMSFSYRVPTTIVSSSDLSLILKKKVGLDDLVNSLKKFQQNNKRIINLIFDDKVSIDFLKTSQSVHIDMRWTKVNKELIKLVIWYDNEWAYSLRVIDIINKIRKL